MKIGVPTEVKKDEFRVGLTPAGVRELVASGHEVSVQAGAGLGSSLADAAYAREGAEVVPDAKSVFAGSELIVKVKEPQPAEIALLEERHTLFTYLHLAPDTEMTDGLVGSGAICIAYETIRDERGRLPLLAPMSEIAGKLAAQAGAYSLAAPMGGRGVLLGGVPGVAAGQVTVIGGGVVGSNAARVALGMGADVAIFDTSIERLRELDLIFHGAVSTRFASSLDLQEAVNASDLIIGAVLVAGARAPHVMRREQLPELRPKTVLVDVAIDQGGCFETSRPTTHSDPTFEVDGVLHYCVANMPGSVPVTSTYALTNATLPYVKELADLGPVAALAREEFGSGLNVARGKVTNAAVAAAQSRQLVSVDDAIEALR